MDTLQLTAWVGSRDALLELILEAKRFHQVQLPSPCCTQVFTRCMAGFATPLCADVNNTHCRSLMRVSCASLLVDTFSVSQESNW